MKANEVRRLLGNIGRNTLYEWVNQAIWRRVESVVGIVRKVSKKELAVAAANPMPSGAPLSKATPSWPLYFSWTANVGQYVVVK